MQQQQKLQQVGRLIGSIDFMYPSVCVDVESLYLRGDDDAIFFCVCAAVRPACLSSSKSQTSYGIED